MTDEIRLAERDGYLEITFDRPRKKNAITSAMYRAMTAALAHAEARDDIACVLFTGTGDAFCAGNDLGDFLGGPEGADAAFAFIMALAAFDKPLVAAVQGMAVGIGTTMLLHCDLVYAADNAKFSMPFSQLGLCPEFASSLLVAQSAGYTRAAEKLMLGEPFLAQEALEMGIVARVLPAAELLAFAQAQAAKLVKLPPASIRTTKALMRRARTAHVRDTIAAENEQFSAMLGGAEAKEAFTAFFEKRKPDFSKFD